ncbi:hypothetical protein PR048_002270 [Dryococelus australis]|uniref:Uncharacterized protein n=1 Tax=Dryococelus australis TaxID=614101 RepID=A0ABQ9IJU3_9NEOP|nr:hypothetical protein PR048_002270 [Dryococelus australis]
MSREAAKGGGGGCCLQTASSSSTETVEAAVEPVLDRDLTHQQLLQHQNNNLAFSFPKKSAVDLEFHAITYSIRVFSRQKLRVVLDHDYYNPAFPRFSMRVTLARCSRHQITSTRSLRHVTYLHHAQAWGPPWPTYSPSTRATRKAIPAKSLCGYRTWESCRMMPLVGFSQQSPVSPASCVPALLHTRLVSHPHIGSQDLDVESRPDRCTLIPHMPAKRRNCPACYYSSEYFAGCVSSKLSMQHNEEHCTLARAGDQHLYAKTRLGKVKEAAGIVERRMEGARVCEAELVASSSHQTALGRARSAARLSSYQLGSPLAGDRPITSAVKYTVVVSGVVLASRTMVSSVTDTNRTGVLAYAERYATNRLRVETYQDFLKCSLYGERRPLVAQSVGAPPVWSAGGSGFESQLKDWADLNNEVLRAGMQGWGETGNPRGNPSTSTIPTCENPGVTRPGIEPGSP